MTELPSPEGVPTEPTGAAARTRALPAWLRVLRMRQWSKNLLVFAAMVFADRLFDATSVQLALLGFAAFCLASSSVYVVNDILDAERDRLHPDKRFRPVAAREISPGAAGALAALLTGGAFALAVSIGWAFTAAIAGYVVLVHFYSAVGKHVVILDTMLVAAGFVIRAVGGALAIGVPSSNWFVLCTFFAALFLALSKRRAEKIALRDGAGRTRSVLESYSDSTLTAFTATSIAATVISYALYVIDAAHLYPRLPLTVPFVLFAVFRYYHLVETSGFGEKPEEVFFRDRAFQAGVIAFAVASFAALYSGI